MSRSTEGKKKIIETKDVFNLSNKTNLDKDDLQMLNQETTYPKSQHSSYLRR